MGLSRLVSLGSVPSSESSATRIATVSPVNRKVAVAVALAPLPSVCSLRLDPPLREPAFLRIRLRLQAPRHRLDPTPAGAALQLSLALAQHLTNIPYVLRQ